MSNDPKIENKADELMKKLKVPKESLERQAPLEVSLKELAKTPKDKETEELLQTLTEVTKKQTQVKEEEPSVTEDDLNDSLSPELRAMKDRVDKEAPSFDFNQMLRDKEFRQTVKVWGDSFTATFRTTTTEETLFVQNLMGKVTSSQEITRRYVFDSFALYNLVMGLHALNGEPLKPYKDANDHIQESLFNERLAQISSYPARLVSIISYHYAWFEERVNNFLATGGLKNG